MKIINWIKIKELIEAAAVAVAIIEQYDVAKIVTAVWHAYRRGKEKDALAENAELVKANSDQADKLRQAQERIMELEKGMAALIRWGRVIV